SPFARDRRGGPGPGAEGPWPSLGGGDRGAGRTRHAPGRNAGARRHGRLPGRRRYHALGRGPGWRDRRPPGARGMNGQLGADDRAARAPGSEDDHGFDGSVPTPVRGKLTAQAPLDKLVWFKSGGAADWLFEPADLDDLVSFLS